MNAVLQLKIITILKWEILLSASLWKKQKESNEWHTELKE